MGIDRDQAVDRVLAYAGSELLCHHAEEPTDLAEEQHKIWQPLLDWCTARFQAPLKTGAGVMPVRQPPESLRALRRAVECYDDDRLALLDRAARATGSLVLGLALAEKHITAAQAFEAAELDATHQMKKWGEDPDMRARHTDTLRELELCEREFGAR